MAETDIPRLSPHAKIAGAFGIGFGFFAGAGVTGLSMLVGILGIWAWISGLRDKENTIAQAIRYGAMRNGVAWLFFIGFFVWVMISAFWSPAETLAGESVRRVAAMLIFAPAVVWAVSKLDQHGLSVFHNALLAGLAIACFLLMFERITGASINRLASPEKDPLAIAGDLGRAATATLALFWAGFACLYQRGTHQWALIWYVVICGFLSLQFGTDLNALGLVLGSGMALLALRHARLAIGLLSGGAALMIMIAPLLYPYLAKLGTAFFQGGQIPLSYGRRAQMWQVAGDLIAQKPLTGWGVGAGSTFDRVISYGGFDWPIIQLHPHAAPLHVWLETGAIGAMLASLAVLVAGVSAMSTFARHKVAAAALVGGLTFLAVQWGLSHAAWREWMWTTFAMVVAVALSLRLSQKPEPNSEFEE